MRRLEIGPGRDRLPGFETLNIVKTPATDHVGDAGKPPFRDGTFVEVYSSHCIEHVESWLVEPTIAEWTRILAPGGWLEVHTVNAAPLMRALLEYEETGICPRKAGMWRADLHRDDPYIAAQLRIMNYPKDGPGGTAWLHRAILTPRYLRQCFERAGLVEIEPVAEPRGDKKHRLINMGFKGRKP